MPPITDNVKVDTTLTTTLTPENIYESDSNIDYAAAGAIILATLLCLIFLIPIYRDMRHIYGIIDYSITCKIKTICCIPVTFYECLAHDCRCEFLNINGNTPEPFCRRILIKTSGNYNEYWDTHRCCCCFRCPEYPFVDKSEEKRFNKKFNIVKAEDEDTKEICSICLETIEEGVELIHLKCNHKHFHKECFKEWIKMSNNNLCPLCRSIII